MKYLVLRGIERDGKWRYEPGDVVDGRAVKGAPVEHWIAKGVLEAIREDEDDADLED